MKSLEVLGLHNNESKLCKFDTHRKDWGQKVKKKTAGNLPKKIV